MGYLKVIFNALTSALSQTPAVPPLVWLTIAIMTLASIILLRIFLAVLSVWWQRRKEIRREILTVVINDFDETSQLWMTSPTRKKLGLFEYQTVAVRGLLPSGKKAGGKSKLVEVRRRNASATGFQDSQIEMSYRLFEMLFPRQTLSEDKTTSYSFQFQRVHLRRGFQQFWFSTNDQLQYQNRFSVYLGAGLTVLQLMIGLAQH